MYKVIDVKGLKEWLPFFFVNIEFWMYSNAYENKNFSVFSSGKQLYNNGKKEMV